MGIRQENLILKQKGLKKCGVCLEIKLIESDFTSRKIKTKKGISISPFYDCEKCRHKRTNDPTYKRQIRYNLTKDEVELLISKDKCQICEQPFKNAKDKHIDHCHDTQFVRGVLCANCNLGLGKFKDDILRLKSAIAYLKKAKSLNEKL